MEEGKDGMVVVSQDDIRSRIFTVRGVQVMLDRDLAACYGVTTGNLNKAVSRNLNRFPGDFRFQLTKEESDALRFQIGIIEEISGRGHHSKYLPYVFTEEGVGQLSAVLHSDTAAAVSVQIVRAFVAMRRFLTANAGLFQRIENVERGLLSYKQETDAKLDAILDRMEEREPPMLPEQLFATGCVWDAYAYVCDLVRSAGRRIVLVDNFVDDRTLKVLDKRSADVEAVVYTRFSERVELDFAKHNAQCAPILRIQLPLHVHDRFLIIDDQVYLLGASVKDMGKGLCAIAPVGFTPDMVLGLLK